MFLFSLLSAALIFGACYVDVYKTENSSSSIYYSEPAYSSANSSSSLLIATHDSVSYKEQSYKAVIIGSQVWIVENLKAEPSSGKSWCYGMLDERCKFYGRLYDWDAAKTVCTDDGWRLPSKADYDNLLNLGALIGASVGWNATPLGGLKNENEDDLKGYALLEEEGFWWASNELGNVAYYVNFLKNGDRLNGYYGPKTRGYSVRCVKNK